MNACKNIEQLLAFEREQLKEEIDEYKWLQSESCGYDITRARAIKEFSEKHYFDWAKSIRKVFCSSMCEFSRECGI